MAGEESFSALPVTHSFMRHIKQRTSMHHQTAVLICVLFLRTIDMSPIHAYEHDAFFSYVRLNLSPIHAYEHDMLECEERTIGTILLHHHSCVVLVRLQVFG